MRKNLVVFIGLSLLTFMISCGGSSNSDDANQNATPITQITSPTDGSFFSVNDTIAFAGSCNDSENGALNGSSLIWRSDIDGQIGLGETCSLDILSSGVHQITLTGTDSEGVVGMDSLMITVTDGVIQNTSPVTQIITPIEGITFTMGEEIQFLGSCTDSEDGDLDGASLVWSSDIDGQIGIGETFSSSALSAGTHQIILTCTDAEGATGLENVSILVNSVPVSQIAIPTDNSAFTVGNAIAFAGNCTDSEDGDLDGAAIVWSSDIDGQIGIGETFSSYGLSGGTHQIILTCTDSEGAKGLDNVSITVNAVPTAQITSPADYSTFNFGDTISFGSSCSDAEDGNLNGAAIVWSSDLDGQIGTGGTFSSDILSLGVHQITLTATDSIGATSSDTIDLTIKLSNPIPDTGQNTSYTSTFGEDADYTINPPSYTKLDASGGELDNSAISWVMVRDNVTGLTWEVKTADGSINDRDDSYSWQNAQDVFITQVNSNNFGGYDDWRIPTIKELAYLRLLDNYNPMINTDYFPNTKLSMYRSSTTFAFNSEQAWYLSFITGAMHPNLNKSSSVYYVRAVRGGQ